VQRPNGGGKQYESGGDRKTGLYDPNLDSDLQLLRRGLEIDPRMGNQLDLLRFGRSDLMLWSVRTNMQKTLLKYGIGVKEEFLLPFCSALVSDNQTVQESASQRLEGLISDAATLRDRNRQLQRRLKDAGFNPGSIDGVLGPKTTDRCILSLIFSMCEHTP